MHIQANLILLSIIRARSVTLIMSQRHARQLGPLIGEKAIEFCTFYEFLISYSKMTAQSPVFGKFSKTPKFDVTSDFG